MRDDSAEILFQGSGGQGRQRGEISKFNIAAPHKIAVVGRLYMGLPLMEMDVWWSWSVSCMIFSRNKLNRMGESKHP